MACTRPMTGSCLHLSVLADPLAPLRLLISPSARTILSRSAIDVYTCGVTRTHLMFSHTIPTV